MIDGAELRSNEGWFRTLIEHCSDAIILFSRDSTVLYASPSIERITGYPPEKYIRKPADHLIPAEDWERIAWNHLLNCQGAEASSTARIHHKDNGWRWIEGTITNLLGDPMLQALMGIYHDITEQKQVCQLESEKQALQQAKQEVEQRLLAQQLQLSERKYRALVDSNIVGVLVSDAAGHIYEANDCLAEMFSYSKEELLSGTFSWYQFLPPQYDAERDQVVHTLDTTRVIHLTEREHIRKDGSRFPTLMAGAVFDREQRRVIMMFLDISDRKEAEQRKQAFLKMVSHELRTPLTGVIGFLDLARFSLQQLPRNYSSEVATTLATVESMLARADHQANIESRMVDELLEVSRLEMHKFTLSLKTCNLIALVREIAYQQQVAHHCSFKLLLPTQEQMPVCIDEHRIEQVVVNYLTNALRYSPPDKEITIGATSKEMMAHVFVHDQGPGLTYGQQKYIWEPFYQAEASVQRGDQGGLGLGLYIAKIIVEQHSGQVGVESKPGQGSTFWFTLPLIREEQAKR